MVNLPWWAVAAINVAVSVVPQISAKLGPNLSALIVNMLHYILNSSNPAEAIQRLQEVHRNAGVHGVLTTPPTAP